MKPKAERKFGKEDTLMVKGVAILMMMLHHCFVHDVTWENNVIVPMFISTKLLREISTFCKLCVPIFVFLSTYGMTISVKKIREDMQLTGQEFALYTKKRYFQLMQGWVIVFLLCQIVCWFANGRQLDVYKGNAIKKMFNFLLDGFGVADLFGQNMLIATWWYMSLATVIIFIFPLLVFLYKKVGAMVTIVISIIVPRLFTIQYEPLEFWLLTMVLGIIFADKNLLVRIYQYSFCKNRWLNATIKNVGYLIILVISFFMRERGNIGYFYEFRHNLLAIVVICASYQMFSEKKYIRKFLCFAGKHSMNIFLVHSFVRSTYFEQELYGLQNPTLIVVTLFLSGLVLSILIEALKRVIRYEKIVNYCREKWFGV